MASSIEKRSEFQFKIKHLLEIQDDFKCSICQSLPRPGFFPMYVCPKCPTKKRRLRCTPCNKKKCWTWIDLLWIDPGSCRTCKSKTVVDSLPSKLFKDLPFQCMNAKYGCQEVLMEPDLFEHESTCVYSKIPCAVQSCSADICYAKFMDHQFWRQTSM